MVHYNIVPIVAFNIKIFLMLLEKFNKRHSDLFLHSMVIHNLSSKNFFWYSRATLLSTTEQFSLPREKNSLIFIFTKQQKKQRASQKIDRAYWKNFKGGISLTNCIKLANIRRCPSLHTSPTPSRQCHLVVLSCNPKTQSTKTQS